MSNARKISDIIVGTEVKVSGVDSDLSNKVADIKSRLDSDDGRLQSLDSSINSRISTIKGRLDSDDGKLQQLDTLIKSNLTNLADSDVIVNQITAKVNSVISNLDSDTTAVQAINTQILSIKNRLDSDDAKLQSLDTTIVNIKSRLDSDDAKIQAVNVLATSALSASGMKDSDLKVVADLRNNVDSEIIYARNLSLTYTNFLYNATAGQTSFSGSDANSLTLAYTAGSILVFLNGIKLEGEDYTATDGTTIVLSEAAAVNNQLVIVVPKIQSNILPTGPDWANATTTALNHPSPAADIRFGVDIEMDETTLVIGSDAESTYRGTVRVYTRASVTSSWSLQQTINGPANNSSFGSNLSLDGDNLAVAMTGFDSSGNTNTGGVQVWTRSGTTWSQQGGNIVPGNDVHIQHGIGGVKILGNNLLIGSPYDDNLQGTVYYYTRSGNTWSKVGKVYSAGNPNGRLGEGLDMAGNVLIVGERDNTNNTSGKVHIFTLSGTTWTRVGQITPSDGQNGDDFGSGSNVKINANGDTIAIGARHEDGGSGDPTSNAGAVYVFTGSGSTWTQQAKLVASDAAANDNFGGALEIDDDGNTIVVAAKNKTVGSNSNVGQGYIFTRSGTSWTEAKILNGSTAASSEMGHTGTAVYGSQAIMGAPGENISGNANAGRVYQFDA